VPGARCSRRSRAVLRRGADATIDLCTRRTVDALAAPGHILLLIALEVCRHEREDRPGRSTTFAQRLKAVSVAGATIQERFMWRLVDSVVLSPNAESKN
jgi:hypothetical protein